MVVNLYMFSRSMEMLVDSCWKRAGSMLRSEEDCWEINLVVNNKIRGTSYQQGWPGHHLGLRGLALQADRSWWRPEVELSGDGDESETQRMILHALQLRTGTWNWWTVRPLGNHVLILQLWAIVWPFCGSCKLSTTLSRCWGMEDSWFLWCWDSPPESQNLCRLLSCLRDCWQDLSFIS